MTDSTQQTRAAVTPEATEAAAKRMPAWMAKYPCENCGTGYGLCREVVAAGLQCCKDCSHPSYVAARPNQWTADELVEMWSGREMPAYIAKEVERLRG